MKDSPAGSFATAPILATAVVPWTDRFEFEEDRFCAQVHTLARGLATHLYVFGTAGEGYAVNERQFDQISRAFWRSSAAAGVTPLLGIVSLSLPTIVERIERGHALGFRHFQISLPSWGALNDRELDSFFAETCGRFADSAFHHYNLMRTKRLLTALDYRRLTALHPNLVAAKCSTDDPAVIADLLTVTPRLRFFFTEFGYAIARRTHDVGLLISLASVHPRRALAFVAGPDARRAADVAELRAIAGTLGALAKGKFHIDGAYDKMLFRMTDPSFPLRLLPPYCSASEADFDQFRAALPGGWRQRPPIDGVSPPVGEAPGATS
jgi:dihydrodipicolinate synthase/N-acetylneuraminate lyase